MSDNIDCNIIDLTQHFSMLDVIRQQVKNIRNSVISPSKNYNVIEIGSSIFNEGSENLESFSQVCNSADYKNYIKLTSGEQEKVIKKIEQIFNNETCIRLHDHIESLIAVCGLSLKVDNSEVRKYYSLHHSIIGDLECYREYVASFSSITHTHDDL